MDNKRESAQTVVVERRGARGAPGKRAGRHSPGLVPRTATPGRACRQSVDTLSLLATGGDGNAFLLARNERLGSVAVSSVVLMNS